MGGGRGGDFGFGMFGMKGWGGDVNIMNVVAKALGLEQTALQTELQNGKTIAQLAKEKNVSTDTIVNAIVAAYKTSLDLAVTNGYLTQTQADAILEAVRAFAPTYLDRSFVSNNPMTVIAKALGMTEADLMTAMRGGKTITQLAQEKNVSTDTIVNALVAAEKAQLDQAVADGRLTQAQADALLKVARVMAPSYLEGTGKFGGKFGPGMMGGRGGHGMGRGGDWGAPPSTAPKAQ
jgi:lambda repressor-like predicted transcriptional regulator